MILIVVFHIEIAFNPDALSQVIKLGIIGVMFPTLLYLARIDCFGKGGLARQRCALDRGRWCWGGQGCGDNAKNFIHAASEAVLEFLDNLLDGSDQGTIIVQG